MPSIKLHTDYCIASGACVLEAPEVFALDDDGVVAQIVDSPSEAQWPTVRRAAAVCPVAVIEIVED
jgi:ferredoxin